MITCFFENGILAKKGLRHVTVGAIAFNENGQILLVKRAHNTHNGGKYSIPGGFFDRNETIQNAVLRELHEETGFMGKIICMFHINDDPMRPKEDRQNVDIIYLVKVLTRDSRPDKEVDEIAWFDKKTLPDDEMFAFDHRKTLLKFFAFQKEKFTLPLLGVL